MIDRTFIHTAVIAGCIAALLVFATLAFATEVLAR